MDRCAVCGCFLELYETSTESGTTVHERCNNKRCRSKQLAGMECVFEEAVVTGQVDLRKAG